MKKILKILFGNQFETIKSVHYIVTKRARKGYGTCLTRFQKFIMWVFKEECEVNTKIWIKKSGGI